MRLQTHAALIERSGFFMGEGICPASHRYDASEYRECPYCLINYFFRDHAPDAMNLFYRLSESHQQELLQRVNAIKIATSC
jgi:hypothetical protein